MSPATKLLGVVLGFWAVMRAINPDTSGRTLIDHILGQQTQSPYLTVTPADATAASIPSTGGGVTGNVGQVTAGQLASTGAPYHWTGSQLSAWAQVIQRESGGNPNARNPSSGAYGIGQFLGGTLTAYAPYGATSSQVGPQLAAMAKYIHDRYGTPANALAHEQQHGWY